jgi:stringent starvation protein B
MGSSDRPSKHQAFLALLQEGWTSLHLDARRDGVVVPPHLKGEAHLVLQYGNDLPIPITDLTVDEEGVRATLSFSRTPQQTIVPWSAVYVIATDDGRGVLYNEDIPSDVAVMASMPDSEPRPRRSRVG